VPSSIETHSIRASKLDASAFLVTFVFVIFRYSLLIFSSNRVSDSVGHTYGLERRVRFVSFSGVGGNDVFGLHRLSDYVDGEA